MAEMTPTLRTTILDALMERWREGESEWSTFLATPSREYMSACLDMILPVAEPMIREAALREAADVAQTAAEDATAEANQGNFARVGIFGWAWRGFGEPK